MKCVILSFLILLNIHLTSAKIIRVPEDSKTIQGAINLAGASDTVLVQPGVYHESINFDGKNIKVGGLYLVTGDTSFISQTIINGDSAKTCTLFNGGEDSTAVLCGFTLTNGNGGIRCRDASPTLKGLIIKENHYRAPLHESGSGGGIFLANSKASIENVSIYWNSTRGTGSSYSNYGGGIYIEDSQPSIKNVIIFENYEGESVFPVYFTGGGICCTNSNLKLTNVTIHSHSASSGGGIYCSKSSVRLDQVTIKNNFAEFNGGGIYSDSSSLAFNKNQRSNIYLNKALIGNDLYATGAEITIVCADTFTVLEPQPFHAQPISRFSFDILYGKVTQARKNLFVNPTGNDKNSGLQDSDPLRTIWQALNKTIADSLKPRTIYLANGKYGASTNDEEFPLYVPDFISLSGETMTGVLLDGEEKYDTGVYFYLNRESTIENLTVSGFKSIFYGSQSGNGIFCDHSSPILNNLTIRHCFSDCIGFEPALGWGHAVSCSNNSNPLILNTTIIENSGSVHCWNHSSPTLINVTISENTNGIYCGNYSNPRLVNTIVWGDTTQKITFGERGEPSSITIVYSNIQSGLDSINTNGNGTVNWLEGNMAVDPQFVNSAQSDFRLQNNSPCINKGIQDTLLLYNNGQDTLLIPPINYLGAAPDLGAIEFDPNNPPILVTESPQLLENFYLSQNFPNPISVSLTNLSGNTTTTIQFTIPQKTRVKLVIYDLLGQTVAILVNEDKKSGNYEVKFNAADLPCGLYLYRLQTEAPSTGLSRAESRGSGQAFVQTNKMLVIK